ncbi:hypothetical protein XELAEV_18002141mg [Xenopus laevis]|nr:hypothetical protein XELAEV_18002141mg [Xenopus laevis]
MKLAKLRSELLEWLVRVLYGPDLKLIYVVLLTASKSYYLQTIYNESQSYKMHCMYEAEMCNAVTNGAQILKGKKN